VPTPKGFLPRDVSHIRGARCSAIKIAALTPWYAATNLNTMMRKLGITRKDF